MKRLLAVVCAVGLAGSVQAANLDKGTYELILNGGIDFDTLGDTAIDLTLGLGTFIADNIEVGVVASLFDDDIQTTGGLGAFAEYNFDTGSQLVPFVGSRLGWAHAEVDIEGLEETEDALELALYGGVKYFITEDLNAFAQAELDVATEDIYAEEDDVEDTNFVINWGLRYLFDI